MSVGVQHLPQAAGWFTLANGTFWGRIFNEWSFDADDFVRVKLPHLVAALIIAFVLVRILRLVTRHMIRVAERHAVNHGRVAQIKTLASIIRATGMTIIGVITGLQFLAALGINLEPLLASAGVAGIAVGLAAQNIVKDVLNGILILLEDQFNVGDTVRMAGAAGTVESMTLRKTTVRDSDGTLHVIPNSQIGVVSNLSVGYSIATVQVSVDISANPDTVIGLLNRIAMEVRQSEDFREFFVADPQVLGMDSVKGSEMIFLVNLKTLATKQYGPMREFRRRVRLALTENHLLPGDPYRVFMPSGEPGDEDAHVPARVPSGK